MQKFLPPPSLTILLDIAPETAVERKAVDRDRYERDLAMQARVRESYQRQAQAQGWVVLDGERPKEAIAADVIEPLTASSVHQSSPSPSRLTPIGGRPSHDSGRRKRPHFVRSPPPSASARTPRASRRSCSHRRPARRWRRPVPPRPRVAAKASRTLRWRRAAGRPVCAAVARTRRRARRRESDVPREVGGLIEAAVARARRDGAAPAPRRPRRRGARRRARASAAPAARASDRRPSYFSAWTIARSAPS